jgi:predicted nucleotidyltransferase
VIDRDTVKEAAGILEAAAPGAAVVLFGSYARGDAQEDSDVDFAVLEPEVHSRHDEMVWLRDALRPLRIPVDLVVVGRKEYEKWADTPGTLWYAVSREGKVVRGTP